MDSIEQKSGIELGRVSSSRSAHVSVPAAVKQEPDVIDGVGVSATTEYEFLTGFRLWSLIIAIMLSMLLLGLDINIVATAIPTISNAFHSTKDISWYGSAFLLAICALQPLAGKLFTYFPLKYTFVAFFLIFELGNLISALARSSNQIIVGRTTSGIGASGLTNGALVIITAACPPKVRPIVSSAGISMIAIGGIIGPLVSGVLVQHVGWQWCFWVFLPPGGVTIIIILLLYIPEQMTKPLLREILPQLHKKLDFVGFCLFTPACIMFLIALNFGGTSYAWNSATVISLLCGSVVTTGLFVGWSIFVQDNALMPPSIIKQRALLIGCYISALQGGATIMMGYYLPVWFQAIKGADPQTSGVDMLPTMISQILGAGLSGALVRKLHYVPPWAIGGSLLTVVGSALMTTFNLYTGEGKWIGYQILAGFGRGAALNMPIISVQEEMAGHEIAVATGAIALFQYLAGSVAITIGQTVFQNELGPALSRHAAVVDLKSILDTGATGFRAITPADQLTNVLIAYNEALVKVFFIPTATAGMALILSFAFPWTKLSADDKKPETEESVDEL